MAILKVQHTRLKTYVRSDNNGSATSMHQPTTVLDAAPTVMYTANMGL